MKARIILYFVTGRVIQLVYCHATLLRVEVRLVTTLKSYMKQQLFNLYKC